MGLNKWASARGKVGLLKFSPSLNAETLLEDSTAGNADDSMDSIQFAQGCLNREIGGKMLLHATRRLRFESLRSQ